MSTTKTFEDDKGKYIIIEKEELWSHNCHPETCGCGNRPEIVIRKYKKYENGDLVIIIQ